MAKKDDLPIPYVDADKETIVTIASGQSQSSVLDGWGFSPIMILVPAAFTASNITFQVSKDGNTFYQLTDYVGTLISVPAEQGMAIPLDANNFGGIRFFRITTSAVQAADRIVDFCLIPLYK